MDGWIVIPNWDRFQHYGTRTPPWIKLYLELSHKPQWRHLNFAQRGLLTSIWVEYAHAKGQLECQSLASLTGQKVRKDTLESLQGAGFIDIVASRPLARLLAQNRSREEKKRERAHAQVQKPVDKPPLEQKTNAGAYKPFVDPFEDSTDRDRMVELADA